MDLPIWARGQIATVGAQIVVVGPPDTVTEGDSNVLLDGRPIAREGDGTAQGGVIVEGSDKIFVNGKPAAFIGAMTTNPMVDPGPKPRVGGPITSN
ncbi:PAAR domain-containing protein [Candidatus Woesearchaeota archaeon]|nr:PAAR domain-containing protein [Candidatus Woesearchaeota archaeon]